MVNVNKNIVPGKPAESSAKTQPQAPARRPRNQELNSSKKLPDSIKSRRKQKLNCSREQVINQLVNEEQIYTQEEAEELVSSFEEQTGATVERLATVKEVEEKDGEFWATKDGRTTLWCRGNGMWYDSGISAEGDALDSSACSDNTADESLNSSEITEDDFEYDEAGSGISTKDYMGYTIYKSIPDEDSGSVGYMVYDGDYPQSFDTLEECKEFIRDTLNSSKKINSASSKYSSKALNCSSEEPEGDADGGESVAEGVDAPDIKITTESGNEVSMQDIKIVQNPDTNELAIFIPEDEEETIPEGFTVIGMVIPDAVGSKPAIEGGDVCPECGQDPCVCEEGSEDGGELDSSKKKSELNCSSSSGLLEVATEYYEYEHDALVDILQSVDNLGYGDAVYEQLIKNYGYEGTDAQQADEALIKMASEDADEHDFLVSLIQAIEDLGYGKQVYTDVLGIGGDINSSVNSSLGGGDDRQDATSQVTVPKSFPDDKVHDLYRWIETELMHEGIDVDVYSVGRPSAGVISFEFEVTGRDPAEVDAIIEDRVQEFVQNGYEGLQYPKGDPRHGLNSEKHEKNLNCKVENARVEPTEQGTWVVKADTDRFGKNAILYEHYSEEGANKYLDRLKAGGDAVANDYSGHIDPKKVDLDSGDGTAEAKLDKASISKAMAKVLLEDKDTPLVYVKLKDGIQAYIQPAGYEDNQLVADGNFDDANIYVAMYDADYKPVMVNGKVDNKMKGSEIVDYIRRNLGM